MTVVGAQGGGYLTVWPCGSAQPNASNLNFVAGQIVPNAVITKLGTGGKVCIFAYGTTDVLVDVNGAFPAGSSFASLVPARLADTRQGASTVDGVLAGGGNVGGGSVLEIPVAGRGGVAANAESAVLNVTVVGAQGDGYLTVWPCGSVQPNASNLNYVRGQTIPNAVVSKIGTGGKVCVYAVRHNRFACRCERILHAGGWSVRRFGNYPSAAPLRRVQRWPGDRTDTNTDTDTDTGHSLSRKGLQGTGR